MLEKVNINLFLRCHSLQKVENRQNNQRQHKRTLIKLIELVET